MIHTKVSCGDVSFKNERPKLVLFGAGKIGRSFIGQLFSRGGYEVVFVDVFKPVIDALNNRKSYPVIIKGMKSEVLVIENVRGVYSGDEQAVISEIEDADILAVSIGQNGLPSAISLIAKGLMARMHKYGHWPLDIIIAENLRNASGYFKRELLMYLPEDYPIDLLVGLVETSIGKMVPIMLKKDMDADILQVFAEPYNNLILDKKGFKNAVPPVDGLFPKENINAWVDRKLFIHNLGHATTAYLGYLFNPNFIFLYDALAVPAVKVLVRKTMIQAADVLMKKYPEEFKKEALIEHIDDLILRFQNKALGDTIYRVGCDLKRKLSAQDRLAGAIHLAIELDLPYDLILNALVSGCHFRATDEQGNRKNDDVDFVNNYMKNGIESILTEICGFDKEIYELIFKEALKMDKKLLEIK